MSWARSAGPLAVVALAAAAATGCGVFGGDDESGSACIDSLTPHLPADIRFVDGADLEAARDAGYDDSSMESAAASMTEIGVWPDLMTMQVAAQGLDYEGDELPYDPTDVDCWLGGSGQAWIASGEFDEQRVEDAVVGDVVVNDDGSLVSDDPALFEEGDPSEQLVAAIDLYSGEGAISFSVLTDDEDDPAVGLGLVPGDDDTWEMLAVWAYADEAAAGDAEAELRETLSSESRIGELIAEDPGEVLTRDGAMLEMRGELVGEPGSWIEPLRYYDEILRPPGS